MSYITLTILVENLLRRRNTNTTTISTRPRPSDAPKALSTGYMTAYNGQEPIEVGKDISYAPIIMSMEEYHRLKVGPQLEGGVYGYFSLAFGYDRRIFSVSSIYNRKSKGKLDTPFPESVVCMTCSKQIGPLSSWGSIASHYNRCLRPDTFNCEICGSKFKQKVHLQRHMKNKHNLGNYGSFPCPVCSVVLDKKSSLLKHIEKSHSESEKKQLKIEAKHKSMGGEGELRGDEEKKSGPTCQRDSFVKHGTHMDVLMKCGTLICNGKKKRKRFPEKSDPILSNMHTCINNESPVVPSPHTAGVSTEKKARTHSLSLSFAQMGHSDKKHHYEIEGGRVPTKFVGKCPKGCPLPDVPQDMEPDMERLESSNWCEHLISAQVIQHDGHSDFLIDNTLWHAERDDNDQIVFYDHDSFLPIDDLTCDWLSFVDSNIDEK